MNNVLIKPVVTEKSNELQENLNRYVFVVQKGANKLQIKDAVEKMYGVTVDAVNTYILPGKAKNRYTKSGVIEGRTSAYKKAVITLAEGEEIDFYANI
ncbi:MAG: 50S ribosomal protein L23 [Saprospiraceae bacterium]|nr:50S ribosomal protein L23 [Saprospiraceae bacterium]